MGDSGEDKGGMRERKDDQIISYLAIFYAKQNLKLK